MSSRAFVLMMVGVCGVAACGGDSDAPATDESLPPVTNGYQYPSGPDEVVIEYVEVGGYTSRELTFQQTPRVLLAGDGRVFSPGFQIEIFPGPLLPAVQVQPVGEPGIQAMLAAADEAGLLDDIEYDQPTNIADASTARVTINVNGETFVHEAYALGSAYLGDGVEESSPERQELADFITTINDLPSLVAAGDLGEQTIFDPSEYGIEALVIDDLASLGLDEIEPTVTDWPAAVAVRLADASTCTVVSADDVGETLLAANQLTFFTDAEVTYQVLAKPILPGTTCG